MVEFSQSPWKYNELLGNIIIPDRGSSALAGFYRQHCRDAAFVIGQNYVTFQVDGIAKTAASSFFAVDWNAHPIGAKKALEAAHLAARSLRFRGDMAKSIVELTSDDVAYSAISRYGDNLNCYFSDLVGLALVGFPRVLSESEATVPIREVLQHPDIASLKAWLVEKKVTELSFQGVPVLESYCRKRFGLELFAGDEDRSAVSFLIAARNLIVHKRAVIDERFVKAVGASYGSVGDALSIAPDMATSLVLSCIDFVKGLDERACNQFKWTTVPIDNDPIAKMHAEFIEAVRAEVETWTDEKVAELDPRMAPDAES